MLSYQPPPFSRGEDDSRTDDIKSIQTELNDSGCGPLIVDGLFGYQTASAVKLFQTRVGLVADGVVGYDTWSAIFRQSTRWPSSQSLTTYLGYAVEKARASAAKGVREDPPRSNRGSFVDLYVSSVGLDPAGGHAWCYAFQYHCFFTAALQLQISCPLPKTGGCLNAWSMAVDRAKRSSVALPQPGWIFILDHGFGKGHAGLIYASDPDGVFIHTVEGNTNIQGSREGDGVYERTRRVSELTGLVGFLDYSFI